MWECAFPISTYMYRLRRRTGLGLMDWPPLDRTGQPTGQAGLAPVGDTPVGLRDRQLRDDQIDDAISAAAGQVQQATGQKLGVTSYATLIRRGIVAVVVGLFQCPSDCCTRPGCADGVTHTGSSDHDRVRDDGG
jgi:hypothetical protein